VPIETRFQELLNVFAELMRRRGERWYLFGAQAVLFWGRERQSLDVDVTVDVDLDDVHGFLDDLRSVGFAPLFEHWQQLLQETRTLALRHSPTKLLLDVVFAGPGLEEEFLDRAIQIRLADLDLPVITPEDLVITKVLAGRSKDIDDAYSILRLHLADLDTDRIRNKLSWLDMMLGRDDLVATLEEQLDLVRQRQGGPDQPMGENR